jgi:hypothetical protein
LEAKDQGTYIGSSAEKKYVAWFGYETYDATTYLSVWFYCGDKKGRDVVRDRIPDKSLLNYSKNPAEEFYVNVRLDASESPGDQEWFCERLERFFPKRT